MICNWDAYVNLLPLHLRADVDRQGADSLQELRLRVGCNAELVFKGKRTYLNTIITNDDIRFVINMASKYSPWAAETLRLGYITSVGGHRIGVCGGAITENGISIGMHTINMLCMRVARDFRDISTGISIQDNSIIIIGRPGCGKTTLLRDLIRRQSNLKRGSVGVVDERCEIFPVMHGNHCFDPGINTDVLSAIGKKQGVEMLLRCMNPVVIAVDEITSNSDCEAIISAGWCGVRLFATAHAGSREELFRRPAYRDILNSSLFNTLVIMHPDNTWHVEGMSEKCIA